MCGNLKPLESQFINTAKFSPRRRRRLGRKIWGPHRTRPPGGTFDEAGRAMMSGSGPFADLAHRGARSGVRAKADIASPDILVCRSYFALLGDAFRSLTPAPPPFSSISATPERFSRAI